MTNSKHAELVLRRTDFDGYHKLETVICKPLSLATDGYAGEMTREVFHCGTIASTLLYIPETDEILFNREFRMAAWIENAADPFLIECSAGGVDSDETPEEAAKREAFEETGSEVLDLISAGVVYPSPSCLAETFHVFIGRIARTSTGVFGLAGEGEQIQTLLLPVAEVERMLDAGVFTNATTCLLLHWFFRHKLQIRDKWASDVA